MIDENSNPATLATVRCPRDAEARLLSGRDTEANRLRAVEGG